MQRAARLSLSTTAALVLGFSSSIALAGELISAPELDSPRPAIASDPLLPAATTPSVVLVATPATRAPVADPGIPKPLAESASLPFVGMVTPSPVLTQSEPPTDRSATPAQSRRHMWGFGMDVGVPDGAGIGLSVRPLEWLRVSAAVTHNAMAPGARLGVTFDPIPGPAAFTLTIEGGHCWSGTVPGVQDSPAISYSYANLHAGLEFGSRSAFRFFLHGGASWLDISASASQPVRSGLSDLSFRGWIAPSAKLGFAIHF